ncbi:dephospho-CoA kinase [soil metagenome]
MLRIGLTGGIGAGKSTVSSTFSELGAIVVDGDVISREVVEPGTDGLVRLVDAFGADILLPDGALNRPALAAIAFSDDEKRKALNGIVHPLVGARREELISAAADDAVIVEDIPLLVESQMAPFFPLVIIVNADVEVRVKRLIEYRGFSEEDARARIAAQATEEQRQVVADVWLDNSGDADDLKQRARALWHERIVPFAHNVQKQVSAPVAPQVVPADPSWLDQARRIVARLNTACGHRAIRIDHIGSTAVPGLAAEDVIDIQVTVDSLDTADQLGEALLTVGYPAVESITDDVAEPDGRSTVPGYDRMNDASFWHKRFHASADPGRPTNVHIRVDGYPNQQFALLFVDWLKANPDVVQDYPADAYRAAWAWADATGWSPAGAQP